MRPTISCPADQLVVERRLAVDESRLGARRPRHLDEPVRVRARRRADDEDERPAEADDLLHRVLAVLRRVTDVVRAGARERRRSDPRARDRRRDVVERERRLGDDGDGLAVRLELARLLGRLDDDDLVRALALRPDHLDVVGVADERDEVPASRRTGAPRRAPSTRAGRRRRRRAGRGARSSRGRPARHRAPRARRSHPAERRPRSRRRPRRAPRAGARRGRCGRSRGGRRSAARAASSSRSTISIARSTPAQNERGAASRTRFTQPTSSRACESASSARLPSTPARLTPIGARANAFTSPRPRVRPSGVHGVAEAVRASARACPTLRAGSREPPGRGEHAALHVDGVGARALAQPLGARPGRRSLGPSPSIVPGRAPGDAERGRPPRARVLPRRRRASRRSPCPTGRPSRPPATPNETISPCGMPSSRRGRPAPSGSPARRAARSSAAGRAGHRQPVSVHAMLRTVSFTLAVAANAADGSNPEWIPQCSQRGSFPGP